MVWDESLHGELAMQMFENGKYFTFCMGVAETQTGDALGMYPQAEINAKAVRRHYELLQIKDSDADQKTA